MHKIKLALISLCISLPYFTYSMISYEQLLEAFIDDTIQPVQEAINAGLDVNACPEGSWPLLWLAAARGLTQIAELLLHSGASVDSNPNLLLASPLHVAANNGFIDIVKLLLNKDAQIDSQDEDGNTPLHLAAGTGKTEVVKLLIENGANIRLRTRSGETTLDTVKRRSPNNQEEIIELLSKLPSLKDLSAGALRKRIRQGKLTLEQIQNNVPQEIYELVAEYL